MLTRERAKENLVEVWINVYKSSINGEEFTGSRTYITKDMALAYADTERHYLRTVKLREVVDE